MTIKHINHNKCKTKFFKLHRSSSHIPVVRIRILIGTTVMRRRILIGTTVVRIASAYININYWF